jgi:ornithine--oxo-acid transaminase
MICDDVQMGLGRTGHLLSADAEGVRPDIVVLGKAMSGGFMPISAVGGRSDVVLSLKTGTHGSTFCSNPMACTISHAAIDVIRDENLVENSRIKGEYMLVLLKQVANKFPRIIKEVRGRGLAIGVDIHPIHNIETIVESIIARGLLIKSSHGRTLRITPPLTLTNEIVEAGVAALSDGLSDYMQHC